MHELLRIFRAHSGLNAHHIAISYPDLSIEFDGRDQNGKEFHIESGPTSGHLEYHAKALGIFQKYRIMGALDNNEQEQMAQRTGLSQFAQSIKGKMLKLNDRVATALVELNSALVEGETAVQEAEQLVVDVKREVAEAVAALGLTSNGPA